MLEFFQRRERQRKREQHQVSYVLAAAPTVEEATGPSQLAGLSLMLDDQGSMSAVDSGRPGVCR